jgi:glycosyltransferase involved in cell wall biosynthesis
LSKHAIEEPALAPSLCVVLPIHNAQASLADHVQALLDVLPELGEAFELLVIDNGSTDATLDVAHDLELRFPQVGVVRHGTPTDMPQIARTALANTRAERILLCDENCSLELRDLHKLWRGRHDFDAILALPQGCGGIDEHAYAQRVRAWRLRIARPSRIDDAAAGYQLLHRRVLEKIRWSSGNPCEMLAELSRQGFRWQVAEVRPARPAPALAAIERPGQSLRVDEHAPSVSGPAAQRRTRLEAIKDFAWGE